MGLGHIEDEKNKIQSNGSREQLQTIEFVANKDVL